MKVSILLVFILSSVSAQVPKRLTLADALAAGEQNSKLLKISSARYDAASARSAEANSYLLPSLRFEGSYHRLSDVDPFQIQPPGFPRPFVISPTVLDNYNLRATVQQPLFTGLRLSSNARAAATLAEAAAEDSRNDESDLVLSVTAAYWTLFQARETMTFVDENVARLEAYRKDTENLLKAGMATRNDLLKIQVQLSGVELSRIDAANDVQVSQMNLNNSIGFPLDTELELASAPDSSVSKGSAPVPGATESRPDLRAGQLRIDAARSSLEAAKGNYWPQVFLAGSYLYNRPNVRYQPTVDEFKSSWDVALTLQLDIWNWGATRSQADQAGALLRQNENLYSQMKDNADLEVRRYVLATRRAEEKISVARLGVEQADENMRSTADKYKSGLATSSELLDASVALRQAKTNFTAALVEHELARARLSKATGSLRP